MLASSGSVSGSLTRSTQRGSRGIGQGESNGGSGSDGCSHLQSDPHRQRSALHQPGPQRVPLDVATDGEEMSVLLDWKAFESPLVDMPFAGRMVVRVIARRVGGGDPAEKLAHPAVARGP